MDVVVVVVVVVVTEVYSILKAMGHSSCSSSAAAAARQGVCRLYVCAVGLSRCVLVAKDMLMVDSRNFQ